MLSRHILYSQTEAGTAAELRLPALHQVTTTEFEFK